jgi:hypothetical protein
MEPSGRSGECLERVAAKAGNYTLVVVDEIELRIARIECLCSLYFQHHYLTLVHCHLGVVVSQTAHWLQLYWLSSAEILLSKLYVKKRW